MTAKSQELINFGSFDNTNNPIIQSSNPENVFTGNGFPSTSSIQPYPTTPPLLKPSHLDGMSNMSNTVMSEITGNIFLDGSQESGDGTENEEHSVEYFDFRLNSKGLKQTSEENHNILVNKMIKTNSFQNVSNSVDYFNQKAFIKRRSQSNIKSQNSSNEYYLHYSLTDKQHSRFYIGLNKKLDSLMNLLNKEKRMKPSQFWGQENNPLSKSLVLRDSNQEKQVREQSDQVELNLQVIINRSNDPNMIKNRYLVKGHIAESTFSNTFKVYSNPSARISKASPGPKCA
jgi:hypothetical protein